MFVEEVNSVVGAAKAKVGLLERNPMGYLIASMLAGMYVGFAITLVFSIGGQLAGSPFTKTLMGVSFGIALSLVIMAGSELFTGNNMVMAMGFWGKTVTLGQTLKLWAVCFVGNWIGSIICAALFFGSGLASGATAELISATAATKMTLPLIPLFFRGMLCNILVCLATWCSFRCKSESGKLIMIFWCLFAFITTGFEHSIANMTLLTISLFAPMNDTIGLGGYLYNILVVSLGNMAGGILCVAMPYYLIAQKKGG